MLEERVQKRRYYFLPRKIDRWLIDRQTDRQIDELVLNISFDCRGRKSLPFPCTMLLQTSGFSPCILKFSDPKPSLTKTGSRLSLSSWWNMEISSLNFHLECEMTEGVPEPPCLQWWSTFISVLHHVLLVHTVPLLPDFSVLLHLLAFQPAYLRPRPFLSLATPSPRAMG